MSILRADLHRPSIHAHGRRSGADHDHPSTRAVATSIADLPSRSLSVASFIDFSSASENAVERAARIAARTGARLQLGYCGRRADPFLVERQSRLRMHARQLERRYGIVVNECARPSRTVDGPPVGASCPTLLVLDLQAARMLREAGGGWWRVPVIRRADMPVLIVRRDSAAAYETVGMMPASAREGRRLDALARMVTDAPAGERGPTETGSGAAAPMRDADLVLAICPAPSALAMLLRTTWQDRLVRMLSADLLLVPARGLR